MSPESGQMLVQQIAPRLRAAIPRCVQSIGAEDREELVQDAIVVAAQMLHRVEVAGKTVTAGNITYYAILHMKAGRRSNGRRQADVMAPGTQIDRKCSVLSLEEEVGYDPELDEPITLGELLAADQDDPSMAAARNADWEEFVTHHDYRYGPILKGLTEGRTGEETAAINGAGYQAISRLHRRLAGDVREFMGEEVLADCTRPPSWKANVMGDRERAACRADRRKG